MQILFENEELLVLEKDAGIVTTSEGVGIDNSVESWLFSNFEWARKVERSGVCHRLDKLTSGIVLVGKNDKTWKELKSLFKERKIEKKYTTLVGGRVPVAGAVCVPIGKSNFFAKRKAVVDGKVALTYFEILRRYVDDKNREYTLLLCSPKTGRTHQIRVHCSYMGWPIVGDSMYGGDCRYLKRQFLHASELAFEYKDKKYRFESKLPVELLSCIDKYVQRD